MITPRIFVATVSAWHGLMRFPRFVLAAGAEVVLMCRRDAVLASTKYASELLEVDGGIAEFTDAMLAHLRIHGDRYDRCLLPDEDLIQELFRRGDPLVERLIPFTPDKSTYDFVSSKLAFLEQCVDLEIPVAKFAICNGVRDVYEQARALGFPLVGKAVHGSGGVGVHIIASQEDLAAVVGACGLPLALQQYVDGQPFSTEVLYDRGVPVCWSSSEQHNRWPHALGSITARRMFDAPDIQRVLTILGKRTNFHGIACVDAIVPRSGGAPVYCEMNPMAGAEAMADRRVFAQFVAGFRRVLQGEAHPTPPAMPVNSSVVGLFPQAISYLTADPRELRRWKLALGSLRRQPFGDRRLLLRLWADLLCAFIPRLGLRTALSRVMPRASKHRMPSLRETYSLNRDQG